MFEDSDTDKIAPPLSLHFPLDVSVTLPCQIFKRKPSFPNQRMHSSRNANGDSAPEQERNTKRAAVLYFHLLQQAAVSASIKITQQTGIQIYAK